jgi:hypothetical protein
VDPEDADCRRGPFAVLAVLAALTVPPRISLETGAVGPDLGREWVLAGLEIEFLDQAFRSKDRLHHDQSGIVTAGELTTPGDQTGEVLGLSGDGDDGDEVLLNGGEGGGSRRR